MTLNAHKALEEYFKLIVNKPLKELTMFDILKAKWNEFWTTRYIFDVPPQPPSKAFLEMKAEINKAKGELADNVITQEVPVSQDYWSFEMWTDKWVSLEGELMPAQHTVVTKPQEDTWICVLDTILDEMEKHYGYNIKEQVYYSVVYPYNEPYPHSGELPHGYGRMLNDTVLQQLLLSFPEVYATHVPQDYTISKGI